MYLRCPLELLFFGRGTVQSREGSDENVGCGCVAASIPHYAIPIIFKNEGQKIV
jgi:hypothetical protein